MTGPTTADLLEICSTLPGLGGHGLLDIMLSSKLSEVREGFDIRLSVLQTWGLTYHRSEIFFDITNQNSSVFKSNMLHADIFRLYVLNWSIYSEFVQNDFSFS